MSLKDTYKHLKDLLAHITVDLDKSENGNKAASQRVRTGTVKLEKIAKAFRKESIANEKKTKGQKKTTKAAVKAKAPAKKAPAHHAPAKKAAAHHAPAKKAPVAVKAKPKAKAVHAHAHAKTAHAKVAPRQLSVKRATAKLPSKKK